MIPILIWYLNRQINQISNLTQKEYIEIKATLHALHDKRYDCATCQSVVHKRRDGREHLKRVKEAMACESVRTTQLHTIRNRIFFGTCIGNFVKDWVYYFIDLCDKYEQGVMPFAGTILEQPDKVIEIFNVIKADKAARISEESAKAQRQVRQNQGHGRNNNAQFRGRRQR